VSRLCRLGGFPAAVALAGDDGGSLDALERMRDDIDVLLPQLRAGRLVGQPVGKEMNLVRTRAPGKRKEHITNAACPLVAQPVADAGAKRGCGPTLGDDEQTRQPGWVGRFEIDSRHLHALCQRLVDMSVETCRGDAPVLAAFQNRSGPDDVFHGPIMDPNRASWVAQKSN